MRSDMQRARGFTLIELIIVIVILGIMAAVLAPMMLSSVTAYNTIQGNVVVLDKQRYAIERLAREIREVKYDFPTPTTPPTPSLGFNFMSGSTEYANAGMGPNSMKFKRTFYDSAGAPSTADVTIDNTGAAVTLQYSTPAVAAQELTDGLANVSGLTFSYLDKDGVDTATVTAVRSVVITLTLTHNGQAYTQRTQVELKNRS